ncbi:MAG: 23S rRNA (adenine(2503)-C(2))-methyltransferase RlmN [Bacteroidales bacterium]
MNKTALIGKTLDELQVITAELNMPRFTALQLCDWLYKKRVSDIMQMSNLSAKHRAMLSEQFCVGTYAPQQVQKSNDGTHKFLFTIDGEKNASVEAVEIPTNDRVTLCVSAQSGCKMGCKFCMTARMGFLQNLNAAQILNQILSVPRSAQLTNLVFMGMGEPLDNLDEVLKAVEIITAPWGLAWSPTRVTVSSIGVLPALQQFLNESKCHLAISLHSTFATERAQIMPMQKAYPIDEVLDVIAQYDWSGQRRVSFEYIVFEGFNDSPRHVDALAKMLGGLECRVNLIRFHQIPDSPLKGADLTIVERFQNRLLKKGINTTIRSSRGEDILAACGMLSTQKKDFIS